MSGISSLLGAINLTFILRLFFIAINYASFIKKFNKYKFILFKFSVDLKANNCSKSNLDHTRLESKMEPDKDPQKPSRAERAERAEQLSTPPDPKHDSKLAGKSRYGTDLKLKNNSWAAFLGRKGPNLYAHQLADSQIKSGKAITVGVLNEILAYSNILVSEDTLNSLINMPRFVFTNLDKIETRRLIQDKLGLPHSKTQVRGVYIFTCIDTNEKYVGSSSQLALRLRGYFNQTHKISGKLIPLIKAKSLASFKLEVICLPYYSEFRPEIVLEQYFLLDPSFNLNTIKVSNNPSGSSSKPLYMYNRDKSILYYYTLQQKDFISKLNISHITFTKHLEKGTYYLGKYLFLREKVKTASGPELINKTLPDIALMLQKDRVKFNKNKLSSLTKAVLLIDIYTKEEILCESLGKCIKYIKSKNKPASLTTLVKYLNSNIAYHGYICKFVVNKS